MVARLVLADHSTQQQQAKLAAEHATMAEKRRHDEVFFKITIIIIIIKELELNLLHLLEFDLTIKVLLFTFRRRRRRAILPRVFAE